MGALRDEITYDSLLSHSALQCGKVKKVIEGQYFQYSPAVDYLHVLGRPRAVR